MQIHPYLCFEGKADEAIEYYQETLGAEVVSVMRASDAPEGACCEGLMKPEAVMHACLRFGQSEVFVSDGRCQGEPDFRGVSLSLALESVEQVKEKFRALAEDGQIVVDLQENFFASSFGMVTDKFGLSWSVLAPLAVPA